MTESWTAEFAENKETEGRKDGASRGHKFPSGSKLDCRVAQGDKMRKRANYDMYAKTAVLRKKRADG